MGSPQEKVVGNSAGGKEDRDWNSIVNQFLFPVFPLTRPRDFQIPAADYWLQRIPATHF